MKHKCQITAQLYSFSVNQIQASGSKKCLLVRLKTICCVFFSDIFNGLFITKDDASNYSWVNHCIILSEALFIVEAISQY